MCLRVFVNVINYVFKVIAKFNGQPQQDLISSFFLYYYFFWKMNMSGENVLAPSDAVNIREGGNRVSGSASVIHKTGVELNNPELRADSHKPVWKAKQQVLALLRVSSHTKIYKYDSTVEQLG